MNEVINIVPQWLPIANIAISAVLFVLALILLWRGQRERKLVYFVLFFPALVLLAGALFQANIIGLTLWTILGTGGRIASVLIAAIITGNELKK